MKKAWGWALCILWFPNTAISFAMLLWNSSPFWWILFVHHKTDKINSVKKVQMQCLNAKSQDWAISPCQSYMHLLSPLHLLESCWRAVMPKSLPQNDSFVQASTDSPEAASWVLHLLLWYLWWAKLRPLAEMGFLGPQNSPAAPQGVLEVVRRLEKNFAALAAHRSLSMLCQDVSVPGGPGTAHGWEATMRLRMTGILSPP